MARLACPVCSLEAVPGPCAGCQALLDIAPHGLRVRTQRIELAEQVAALDFRRDPLPGGGSRDSQVGSTEFEGVADGIRCRLLPGKTCSLIEEPFRARDAALSMTAIAEGAGASFGLIARHIFFDAGGAHYFCEVEPSGQRARVGRRISLGDTAVVNELLPWTPCNLAPLGRVNRLELRFQGPDLQVHVNGAPFAVVHDPALGMGHVGLRVAAGSGGPATIRIIDMQIWLTRS